MTSMAKIFSSLASVSTTGILGSPVAHRLSVKPLTSYSSNSVLGAQACRPHLPVLSRSLKTPKSRNSIASTSPLAEPLEDGSTEFLEEKYFTPTTADTEDLKFFLLRLVAGSDRGLAASDDDARDVEDAVKELEAAGKPVDLSEDLNRMQGRWRLVYSSGFLSGSLGGQRPGPPIGRLPISLGQVTQRIDVAAKELDNCLDLKIATPWPLPTVELSATLAHSFQTTGKAGIRITFEKTTVRAGGALKELPPFSLPQLPEFLRNSSEGVRSGEFETVYLENDLRISRGDRGEVRIFVKC